MALILLYLHSVQKGGSGRRKLSMILTDAEGYTLQALKSASNNGKNVLYLVPIQEALSTDPLPYDAPEFSKMPQADCVSCGQKMPLQMLALHVEECSVSNFILHLTVFIKLYGKNILRKLEH